MAKAVDPKIRKSALRLLEQGHTPQEVAGKLGLPRTTVASWKNRAAQVADHAPPAEMPAAARPPSTEPLALTVRNGEDLQRLRVVPRIKALAAAAGLPEAALCRACLLVGLARVESDPGLIGRAAALAGEGMGAAA